MESSLSTLDVLQNEWAQISTESLQLLVASLPRRVEGLLAAKVGPPSCTLNWCDGQVWPNTSVHIVFEGRCRTLVKLSHHSTNTPFIPGIQGIV